MSKMSVQVGYYSKEKDMVTTFEINEEIKKNPEEKAFKEGKIIQKLNLDTVEIDFEDALNKARDFKQKEYPKELVNKDLVILQHIEAGVVYNVTLITMAFKTLNIKIDAKSGEVLSHELRSIMEMGKNM